MKTSKRIDSQNELLKVKQDELLIQWMGAHIELKRAKERELTLRNEILEQVGSSEEGTEKVVFGSETIKVVSPVRRTVVGEVPDSLKHVVQYKPSLKLDVYRGLSDWNRKRMDKLMDIKAGQKGLRV